MAAVEYVTTEDGITGEADHDLEEKLPCRRLGLLPETTADSQTHISGARADPVP